MSSRADDIREHVIYQIVNARVRSYPYEHLVVHNVFPRDFYTEIQRRMPGDDVYTPLNKSGRVSEGYPDTRLILADGPYVSEDPVLARLFQAIDSEKVAEALLHVFSETIAPRLRGEPHREIVTEAFLMRDRGGFSLGPHTDSPKKIFSALFYLPANAERASWGTSLYRPKVRDFACKGGPHHSFEDFERVFTLPFVPNTLVAFPKTDWCFHGVEPISGGVPRDVLFFDAKVGKLVE